MDDRDISSAQEIEDPPSDKAPDHIDLPMSEIEHGENAVDHGVADGDQGIDTAKGQTVDKLLR